MWNLTLSIILQICCGNSSWGDVNRCLFTPDRTLMKTKVTSWPNSRQENQWMYWACSYKHANVGATIPPKTGSLEWTVSRAAHEPLIYLMSVSWTLLSISTICILWGVCVDNYGCYHFKTGLTVSCLEKWDSHMIYPTGKWQWALERAIVDEVVQGLVHGNVTR